MSHENAELREVLSRLAPEAQEFLTELIRIPSTHGNEAEAVTFAEEAWSHAGFPVERHPIPESLRHDPEYTNPATECDFTGRDNLVVRIGRGEGRSAIINSHLDVVPAEDWEDGFQPRVDGGTIYGRGACDAKGCQATMFLAARALQELGIEPAGQVAFAMVVAEEVGGNGSLSLIREGERADGVVVIEPTSLAMHPANRGAIWFRFEFTGKSCHMGRKHEGVNAIDLACETMQILYAYEQELIGDQEDQPLFADYEFPTQVNVGTLHSGDWPSMVPGKAVMEGGIGFLPNRPMEQVKEDVVRYIDEKGSEELKQRYELSFPRLHNDSYETPPDHPFVQAFHRATLATDAQDTITGWNVSCDARSFAKLGGMPTVVFGAGDIRDAHSAGEKVEMADIVTAAETLVRFIEEWCNGEHGV